MKALKQSSKSVPKHKQPPKQYIKVFPEKLPMISNYKDLKLGLC